MKELLIRSLSGLLLGAILLLCILGSSWTFAIFALFVVCMGTFEMSRLQNISHPLMLVLGELIAVASFVVAVLTAHDVCSSKWLLLDLLLPLLVFLLSLFSKHYDFNQICSFLMGSLLFLSLPMSLMTFMYRVDLFGHLAGARIIILIFCLLWTNDIFAYFTGRLLGKHKLFERISPGKTIEGSIGGLVFTLMGICVFSYYSSWLPLSKGIGLGLVAVVFGTLGDLSESMLKRHAGVKDSGKLIPGHGGFLDRFDSVLFSVPFIFVYLLLL